MWRAILIFVACLQVGVSSALTSVECEAEGRAQARCLQHLSVFFGPYWRCNETFKVFHDSVLPQRSGVKSLHLKDVWGDSRHGFQATRAVMGVVQHRVRPGDVVIEFGTFRGFMTYHMAWNAREGVDIITVDSGSTARTGYDPNAARQSYPNYTVGEAFVRAPDKVRRKITQVITMTKDFDIAPYRDRVSLVWVDAGHSYEACLSDSMAAVLMVQPGGYVMWDDIGNYWPGVPRCVKAVQEWVAARGVLRIQGGLGWYRRSCAGDIPPPTDTMRQALNLPRSERNLTSLHLASSTK